MQEKGTLQLLWPAPTRTSTYLNNTKHSYTDYHVRNLIGANHLRSQMYKPLSAAQTLTSTNL